jgi:hypothetical protein
MQLIQKNLWHSLGVAGLIVLIGVLIGVRIANRPIAYFFEEVALFQSANKEAGVQELTTRLSGEHQIYLIVSPGKTGSLTSANIFALDNPNQTQIENMITLSSDFLEKVETLVAATDPNKNTSGVIELDGAALIAEPPTGDQIDASALAQNIANQILFQGDVSDPIQITYQSSEDMRKRFEETQTTLESLLAAPLVVVRNDEEIGLLEVKELADLLTVTWPNEPPIQIDTETYTQSRFATKNEHIALDFTDPKRLRFDTKSLPIPRESLLEHLTAASTDRARKLYITVPEPELDISGLHLITSFTTYYDCCQDRVTNIEQITNIINGTVLEKEEVFSLNTAAGERTEEKGFVPAGSILGGELVDSVGGGVSQFATTLYNAVYWSGLQDIHHQPHSWSFSRYPTGIEATISWPAPDLVFKNNTSSPIVIRTFTTDTSITAEIWGDNDGRITQGFHKNGKTTFTTTAEGGPDARIVSSYTTPPYEELNSIPTLIYPDISTARFTPKVVSRGVPGKVINVFRTITTQDNEHTDFWKVTYKPIPREIHVHPCDLPPADRVHRYEKYDYSWVNC